MIIIRDTKIRLCSERERIYEELLKQYKNGLMIIPPYLDVVYTDEWNEGPEFEVHKAEEKND